MCLCGSPFSKIQVSLAQAAPCVGGGSAEIDSNDVVVPRIRVAGATTDLGFIDPPINPRSCVRKRRSLHAWVLDYEEILCVTDRAIRESWNIVGFSTR